MSHFQVRFLFPKWDQKQKRFHWSALEVKDNPPKGKGVFARCYLPEGTVIPYLGHRLSAQRIDHHYYNQEGGKRCSLDLTYLVEESASVYIDAHPRLDNKNLFIASYVNEPTRQAISNCRLMRIRKAPGVVLMVTYPILNGQELTWYYGRSYIRKGYIPGKDCDFPSYQPKKFVKFPNQRSRDRYYFLLSLCSKEQREW